MALLTASIFVLVLSCSSAHKSDKHKSHGISDLTIFRGTPVQIREVPFVARLIDSEGSLHCGAAIVSERYLVSAAHCTKLDLSVVVGSDDLENGQKYEIKQFYTHPDYKPVFLKPDIAVIELTKNMTFGKTVKPIPLADANIEIKEDAIFEAMGFGLTENREKSRRLLKVDLPFFPQDKCTEIYSEIRIPIDDVMICAGGTDDGKDTCTGDSGGPLVYKDILIGVTSFGEGCGHKGIPGVFSRISALRSFIDDVINP